MINFDVKDKKILYELDENSRQSLSQLGKKVGLKKDALSHRIQKMKDANIIKSFYTVIDSYRLGYSLFRYYIDYQCITTDVRKEIINHFTNYKNISTVGSVIGTYDLIVVIWVDDIHNFYSFWNDTLNKYGDYFEKRIFSVYIHGMGYRQSYLQSSSALINDRDVFERFGVGKKVSIDRTDYKLLDELALHSRKPLIDLAEKLDTSSQTVSYRINKLKQSGIIQAFRVAIDEQQFGYKRYKVDVALSEHGKRGNIIQYIQQNPHLLYVSTSTGLCDLELELVVRSAEKVVEIMEDVNVHFPRTIRKYNFYGNFKAYKETFLPRLFD
jgi:DNA-binding Lrp family transcriptional regulator